MTLRAPVGVLAMLAAAVLLHGCGGHGGAASVPAHTVSMQTPNGMSPGSIPAPPMAKTPLQTSSAMTSRTPQSAITPLGFNQLPGAGQQIAASPDGTFWVLSTQPTGSVDKYIFHYVGNGNYVNVEGAASRIAVGPDNTPWVVNSAGGIYHLVNGSFAGIAGGASDVSVGADGSVYVISNQGGGPYGRAIFHYAGGTWTQLPGAGVRVAASWDNGNYPHNIGPGGFYVLNAQGGIFYYYPPVGFTQIPGAALDVAPTTNGGVFVLGYPANPNGTQIFYDDLNNGVFTPQPGAGFSLSTNTANVYVIGRSGAIYVSPNRPPNFVAPNRSDGVTQFPTTASNQFASSMLGASQDGTLVVQSPETPGDPVGQFFTMPEYTISASEGVAGFAPSSQSRAVRAVAPQDAPAAASYLPRVDALTAGAARLLRGRSPLTAAPDRAVQAVRRTSALSTGATKVFHVMQDWRTSCVAPKIAAGSDCYLDVPTHLQYVSAHAYVWVDDAMDASYGFTQNDWVATGTTFDNGFTRLTQAFAPAFLPQTPSFKQCDANGATVPPGSTNPPYQTPPDLTGTDPHISIVVTKALENVPGDGGFFDVFDLLNDQEYNCFTQHHVPSNALPMFVIGADKYRTAGGSTVFDEAYWRTHDMPRLLPHQFQHYLHALNKVIAHGVGSDDAFLDEGDSMLAEDLVLGGAVNPPQSPDTQLFAYAYLNAPGNFSLTAFAGYDVAPGSTPANTTYTFVRSAPANYGVAYLFARYLYDRFGQDAALHRLYADTSNTSFSANVRPIESEAGEPFDQVYGEFAAALAARNVASTDPRFTFGSNVLLRGATTVTVPGGAQYGLVFNGPRSAQDLTSTTPQNLPRITLSPGSTVSAKLISGATQFINVAPSGGSIVSGGVTGARATWVDAALVQGAYDDAPACFGPIATCHG